LERIREVCSQKRSHADSLSTDVGAALSTEVGTALDGYLHEEDIAVRLQSIGSWWNRVDRLDTIRNKAYQIERDRERGEEREREGERERDRERERASERERE